MKCIYNGIILHKGIRLKGKALIYDEKIIDIVDENLAFKKYNCAKYIDAKNNYISAGFIDMHIHGYEGCDVMDGKIKSIETIASGIIKNGVTSFLPTTMTMDINSIKKVIKSIADVKNSKLIAEIIGVNVEGPYINKKYKGAQNELYIQKLDSEFIINNKNIIKMLTVAPEVEGALEFIQKVKEQTDIVLSIGHTGANYDEALAGIKHGISHVTHLFNAMPTLHHRKPGTVGVALSQDVSVEIIADTVHIHKSMFEIVLKIKGTDKVALITDSISATNLSDGTYSLGGQEVKVVGNIAKLKTNELAGSVLKLNIALKNLVKHTDYKIEELVKLCTINPAKILKIHHKKGSLDHGKDADIIIFDNDINIKYTICRGQIAYKK